MTSIADAAETLERIADLQDEVAHWRSEAMAQKALAAAYKGHLDSALMLTQKTLEAAETFTTGLA